MSANNANTDSPDGPLGSDIDRFARYLVLERGRSANTLAAYRNDLAAYNQWLAERGIDDLSEVTSDHIDRYATSQTGSPRSVQRRLSAIRSFHSYLVESGSQTTNPASTVMGPAQPQRLPKALAVDTVIRLLDSVGADDPVSLRDRALLEVLYGTGARVSEVVALAVDDVVDTSGSSPDILRVIGKGDKERIVPLGSHAKAALDAYLVRSRPVLTRKASRATPALFVGVRGRPLSRQSAWLVLRDRAEAAGVTETLSPHTLRHSCATHLIAGGADIRVVQELLGHQSVQTTQIYTKVTIDSLRDVYYTSHPRARS